VEDRLTRLERQLTRQRWVVAALLALVVSMCLLGFRERNGQDRIRTSSITIVNDEGKVCGGIYGEKEGGVLLLYEVATKDFGPAVKVEANREGGEIALFDESAKPSLELFGAGGQGALLLRGHDQKDSVAIGTDPQYGGTVLLNAPDGGRRISILAMPDGGYLRFLNSSPHRGWPVNLYASGGNGELYLADGKGNTTAKLPDK
jgi:hypothetical protein